MKIFCRKGGRTDRLSSFPSTLFLLAPAWGATRVMPLALLPALLFLLTPPHGGDQLTLLMLTVLSISTHAPT